MTEHQVQNEYRPILPSPPGQTLADLLEERGVRQNELAVRMGMTPKFVNELVAAKATISPTTALALEKALGIPAEFWLTRDAHYQEALARQQAIKSLTAEISWLDELPLKDMRSFGWIESSRRSPSTVEACLKFFGVASVAAWRQCYVQATECAAYRKSQKVAEHRGSVAAWLRQGEIEAGAIESAPFDRDGFMKAVKDARQLTLVRDPREYIPELQRRFSATGVAIAVVRHPKGCPVNGAVRWLSPQKALIQLSMRYLTDDIFWFTFFHECGHIALHGKKILFLEEGRMTGDDEDEANQFSAECLIPSAYWSNFTESTFTAATIEMFAKSIGVAPGIIVGRLQHEKLVPYNHLNGLKQRYTWTQE